MTETLDPKLLDRRTVERYLKNGMLDEKTYERFLKGLPDVADKSEPIATLVGPTDDADEG
jgi:hypothetical protein